MAVNVGTIEAVLRLRDELSAKLAAIAPKLEAAGESFQRIGSKAQAAGSAMLPFSAAVAGAAVAAFKFGKDFESSLTKIETLVGLSSREVAGMREEVLRLSGTTAKAPKELADALYFITSAGFKGQEALDTLTASAKASAIGLGATEVVADAVTSALNAYGSANISSAEAVRVLIATVREGKAEADAVAGAMGRVIPIAAEMGVAFQDVGSFIAATTRTGLSAEESVVALRGALTTLAKPTKDQTDAFADLISRGLLPAGFGLETIRKKIREEGLAQGFIELTTATKGNIEALTSIIGNIRAATGVLGAYGRQADTTLEIQKIMRTDLGELGKGFARVSQDVDFKLNQALADLQTTAISVFETFKGQFTGFVVGLGDITKSAKSFADEMAGWPAVAKTATMGVAGAVAIAGPGLIAFGSTVRIVGFALEGLGVSAARASVGFGLLGRSMAVLTSAFVGWKLGTMIGDLKAGENATMSFAESFEFGIDKFHNWATGLKGVSDAQIEETIVSRRQAEAHKTLGDATGKLPPEVQKLLDGFKRLPSVMADNASGAAQLTDEVKELRDQLSGAKATADIANLTKAFRALAPAQRVSKEIMERFAEAALAARKEGGRLTPEMEKVVKQFGHLASKGELYVSALPKVIDQTDLLRKKMGELTDKGLIPINESFSDIIIGLPTVSDAIGAAAENATEAANRVARGMLATMRGTKDMSAVASESFDKLAASLAQLAQVSGDSFGAVLRDIAQFVVAMKMAEESGKALKKAGGELGAAFKAGSFKGIVAGFANISSAALEAGAAMAQATSSGSQGMRALKGAAAGAQIGMAFGPIGAAVGAAVGAIVGAIRGRQKEFQKIASDIGRDMGVMISENLAKAIEKDSKRIGDRVAASLLHLAEIVKEAGGVMAFGFDKAITKTHDLFSMIETGKLMVRDVGPVFNEMFGLLLPEAVDKGTGLAKQSFLELIDLAQRFGVESEAMAKFLAAAGDKVTSGFGAVASMFAGPLLSAVEKLDAKIKEAGEGTAEAAALMADKQRYVQASVEQNQAAFDRMGRLAVAAFGAALASGQTFLQALASIGPALDALVQAQQAFGFASGETFGELMKFRQFAEQNKEIVASIDGVNQMMVGLQNLGLLTEGTFADLTATAVDLFDRMVVGGLTGDQALRMMQPSLQTIWKLQQDFGYAVDESTQKLLDQAVEAGIVGDKQRDAMDRVARATERVADIMERLATHLGVDIPDAARRGARGVQDAFDGLDIRIPVSFDGPGIWDPSGKTYDEADPVPMAAGGAGITRRPTLFLAGEEGPEPFAFGEAAAGGGGAVTIRVPIYLDGRQIAEATVPHIPDVVRRYGLVR